MEAERPRGVQVAAPHAFFPVRAILEDRVHVVEVGLHAHLENAVEQRIGRLEGGRGLHIGIHHHPNRIARLGRAAQSGHLEIAESVIGKVRFPRMRSAVADQFMMLRLAVAPPE